MHNNLLCIFHEDKGILNMSLTVTSVYMVNISNNVNNDKNIPTKHETIVYLFVMFLLIEYHSAVLL